MATDSAGELHVVWYDWTSYAGSGSDMDIFYKQFGRVPNTPLLDAIAPPTTEGVISLHWNDTAGALWYYVYRDNTAAITSISGKTPIAKVTTTNYKETITVGGTYHYALIAGNTKGNSSLSNSESVTIQITTQTSPFPFELPFSNETLILILMGVVVVLLVIIAVLLLKRR